MTSDRKLSRIIVSEIGRHALQQRRNVTKRPYSRHTCNTFEICQLNLAYDVMGGIHTRCRQCKDLVDTLNNDGGTKINDCNDYDANTKNGDNPQRRKKLVNLNTMAVYNLNMSKS